MSLKIPLKEFQEKGVKFMHESRYVLNGDEMGLGKTAQTIAVIDKVREKTFIACPASIRYHWVNEIKKFSDWEFTYQVIKSGKDVKNLKDVDVYITSYHMIHRLQELMKSCSVLVLDECHKVKNSESRMGRATYKAIGEGRPEFVIMLSGTPVTNRVHDWYQILKILSLNPHKTNGEDVSYYFRSFRSFASHFCFESKFKLKTKYGSKIIYQYKGFRSDKKGALRKLLVGKYFRRKASKVLDLEGSVNIDMVTYDREAKKEVKDFTLDEKVESIIQKKQDGAINSIDTTVDYVDDLLQQGEGPVVIFTDHLIPLANINKKLKDKKYKGLQIQGSTNAENRQIAVDSLQRGDLDFLVLTYGAGSEGLTLTKSNNMVLNDLPWTPKDYLQAIKRIDRIGQTKLCKIHRIIADPITDKMLSQLDEKIKNIKEAT